jgi:Zn finger protein HypA/HybF involved in hydrogenase expression
MNKIYVLPDDQFLTLVASCTSYTEVLQKLGLSPRGGTSSKLLKKRLIELKCSTSHFKPQHANAQAKAQPLSTILVENSAYTNINRMKIRIIRDGLMQYECTECGLGPEWNGKPITLQLDHINGIHDDHRLTNLRFLCPNCHSQTDSFAGRNKPK